MAYTAVISEGGLFASDLLDRIASGEAEGQRAADFGIDGGRRLIDETQSAFADARSFWDAFQRRRQRSRESATTLTREDWMVPFLELLGFDHLVLQRASAEAGGETFFISHRAGEDPDAPPVHIVSLEEDLDKRGATGRLSPHAAVQGYLNRADALWGLTTNGRQLRLLRDTTRFSKPTYLEFNIEGMIDENLYGEFVLLYRLLHASRFPRDGAAAHECLLERYYQQGIDEGTRVRDKLRDGVQEALKVLGTAFLAHPDSQALRERVEAGGLDEQSYYRQLLRLVYRLLFLMVAEERRLIFPPDEEDISRHAIYEKYYSVSHLRRRCERYFASDGYSDLWQGLVTTLRLFREDDLASKLGLRALNGELFGPSACADLENASCTNEQLLIAIRHLSTFIDEGPGRRHRRGTGLRRRVNYGDINVEEFGSVYESLLDFNPRVTLDPPAFDLVTGSERKQTGSYYTPPELVRELIGSALVPVVEERLAKAKTKEEEEQALLSMKVCDPAAGSGHFLLAAARRIARELAKVRVGEDEPTPSQYREAVRDVIRSCIYAVDKNPLAVDLCKVALWIEGHSAGLPLSFLDHHIKCGDSLVGVFDLDVLTQGIPDGAYKPVTGDDKLVASAVRKRNKAERIGQLGLAPVDVARAPTDLAPQFAELARQEERAPDDVHAKEQLYERLRAQGSEWWRYKVACDLWTAAFFTPLTAERWSTEGRIPTTNVIRKQLRVISDDIREDVKAEAIGLSQEQRFFHWPLEFPDVFADNGFDVVLGNPPWERIKLQEQEFFAGRDPEITKAPNKAARERLIKKLPEGNPALAVEFARAQYTHAAVSRSARASERFRLTAVGDINTYALFTECMLGLVGPGSRVGCVVPSGIATDEPTKAFFQHLLDGRHLVSLFDFENRRSIFKGTQGNLKFCLLTLSTVSQNSVLFGAQMDDPVLLRDPTRTYSLDPAEIASVNPNTRNCPMFRTADDARVVIKIHSLVPIFVTESDGEENAWDARLYDMFHMSSDSSLFMTKEQLENSGWILKGSSFCRNGARYAPLCESKLVQQFNHRAATFEGVPEDRRFRIHAGTREQSPGALDDSSVTSLPRYWVSEEETETRHGGAAWLLAFRNAISAVADSRSLVACILPPVAVGNSLHLVGCNVDGPKMAALLGSFNSFVVDYVLRQKASGGNLNFYILKQLPVVAPDTFDVRCPWSPDVETARWLCQRVLELTYTASDLQHFAMDLGYDGPPFRWNEERRFELRCELDAAYFHLYNIAREDVRHIMEAFPIVKRRDEERHGEYRTKRVILEVYDAMAEAMRNGKPYQTLLDPPPADPRVAHDATAATNEVRPI